MPQAMAALSSRPSIRFRIRSLHDVFIDRHRRRILPRRPEKGMCKMERGSARDEQSEELHP